MERHKSVPKRHLFKVKHSANTTQMNFTKGLKLPSTRGMKSIGDDSAEDNITNQSNQEQEDADPMNIQASNHYNTDNDEYKNKTSLNLVQKTRRRFKGSKRKQTVQSNVAPKVRPFPTTGTSVSPHRILLFEKQHFIGNKQYLIEISRDKLHMFIIAFLIEKAKYYTMQVPIKQAFKLLLELDNSFDALIDLLYFSHNRLLLPDFLRGKFSPRHIAKFNSSHYPSEASNSIADGTPKGNFKISYYC